MPLFKAISSLVQFRTISLVVLFSLISFCAASSAFAQNTTTGTVNADSSITGSKTGSTVTGSDSAGSSITGSACGQTAGALVNPLKFCDLSSLIDAILKAVISLGTIILTFALIFCGFRFVAAQGNPEKITQARNTLIWTIIGGLILLGATAIKEVIQATVTSITP